jgi:hypothetical protein
LSIDPRVWPSVFDLDELGRPPSHFGYQSLWADLIALRRAVTMFFEKEPLKPFRTIAVTLLLGEYCERDRVDWDSLIPPPNPDRRADDWLFLGYDVGDMWMLSALSNCGFLPGLDDAEALRRRWGPLLNKYHLFDEIEPAVDFKHFSDERLKGDHAPCFVFGLWVVQ